MFQYIKKKDTLKKKKIIIIIIIIIQFDENTIFSIHVYVQNIVFIFNLI